MTARDRPNNSSDKAAFHKRDISIFLLAHLVSLRFPLGSLLTLSNCSDVCVDLRLALLEAMKIRFRVETVAKHL